MDFCEFLSPTPEEQEARTSAVERVSQVIKYIWPRCKVPFFVVRVGMNACVCDFNHEKKSHNKILLFYDCCFLG